MVQSLCSLHNFLIDEYSEKVVPEYTAGDSFFLEVQGAIPLESDRNLPSQLTDSRQYHSDDGSDYRRSRLRQISRQHVTHLPRDLMHEQICVLNLTRPV